MCIHETKEETFTEMVFEPCGNEWLLKDKRNGKILHRMGNPSEEIGEDPTIAELYGMCMEELETADRCYSEGNPYNGVFLKTGERLTDFEMEDGAYVMAEALCARYNP